MVEFSPRFKTRVHQATTGLTIAAATAAMVLPAMTHEEPRIGSGKTSMDVSDTADWYAQQPKNQPSWNKQLSRQFDGFQDMNNKPAGAVPSEVIAVGQDGQPNRMPFDKAWELSHDDEKANDIWTVGGRWNTP